MPPSLGVAQNEQARSIPMASWLRAFAVSLLARKQCPLQVVTHAMYIASVQDSPESRTLVFLRRTIPQIQVLPMVVEFVLVCTHNMHVTPHRIFQERDTGVSLCTASPRSTRVEKTQTLTRFSVSHLPPRDGVCREEMKLVCCRAEVILSASQITLCILLFL